MPKARAEKPYFIWFLRARQMREGWRVLAPFTYAANVAARGKRKGVEAGHSAQLRRSTREREKAFKIEVFRVSRSPSRFVQTLQRICKNRETSKTLYGVRLFHACQRYIVEDDASSVHVPDGAGLGRTRRSAFKAWLIRSRTAPSCAAARLLSR